ncbi:MAG: tRNA-dependent lipid II--amino acid ligase [Myxococcaceae bacterium]|nr:tRNA-dependent lipid II--amino acid ligase [Myxococcaceae bacterium]
MEVLYRESLTGSDATDFDRFVDTARSGHAFQTRAWAKVATADRSRTARFFLAREGAVVGAAVVLRPRAGVLVAPTAVVERGPVCAAPTDLGRVLRALAHATRARGVVRLTAMPYWSGVDARCAEAELASARFRSVQRADGAHVVTLRIDIGGKSDEQLLAGGEREALRRKLRHASGAGAVARRGTSADLAILAKLDAERMGAQGKRRKPRAWFDAVAREILPTRGAVFVCEHARAPIASLLVLRHGHVATFVLGASTLASRPFSKMALPLLEAMRWARDGGCTQFDLGGVPMEGDVDPKRLNIAQFKSDFARTRVHLAGEHARWL